jgi:transcriptional regulator with XRE-family HTH domain
MSKWAANLIRLARHDGGLSQRALAHRAGTSQAAIASYEAGKRSPTLDTLARIVRAAGFDLRILIEPYDNHDDVVSTQEAILSKNARDAAAGERAALRALANRERVRPGT